MKELSNRVETFLTTFKYKCKYYGVIVMFRRSKNIQTLLDLDINRGEVASILQEIKCEDYSEGPLENNMPMCPDLWVFGKIIKQREVYIKVHEGATDRSPICISFHISEYPMNYPLKTNRI